MQGAGHHATERYGIKALADRISREFDVEAVYVELDNPILVLTNLPFALAKVL